MDSEPVIFALCVVDFHHTKGPEVEYWYGLPQNTDSSRLWPNLPFQALPDGSHSFKETFTYFTLLYNEETRQGMENTYGLSEPLDKYKTLFAISCSQQIKSDELLHKDKDITRSTVQKAIVVISREPIFGQIKDKLSIVTNVFFSQRNFSNRKIIASLHDNLQSLFKPNTNTSSSDSNLYFGLSLRRALYDFKKDILILLKTLLLEKKIIFYGRNVESMCNLQFALISLIPNLISSLQKSASPLLSHNKEDIEVSTSFRSSDRQSVLKFLGFPLLIFEKAGLFQPYTPLQQIDDIKSEKTKFFMIGTSNSLLLEQKDELCDVFVNCDDSTITIISKSLQPMLQLSYQDKKWAESIAGIVDGTWNENDLETPKNSQFEGSEDFIRWQFEEYLTGLLSSAKLSEYIEAHKENETALNTIPEDVLRSNPINLFNENWVREWKTTQNFEYFNLSTDDRLFDLFPPKHTYAGNDTLHILQQKLALTFQNLKKHNSNSNNNNNNMSNNSNSSVSSLTHNSTGSTNPNTLSRRSSAQSSASNAKETGDPWASVRNFFNPKKKSKSKKVEEDRPPSTTTVEASDTEKSVIGLGLNYVEVSSKGSDPVEKKQG